MADMTTLERMARAIAVEAGHSHPTIHHARQARAALEAIREPSASMIVNGREAILPISYGANAPVNGPAVAGVWRDMIDAALTEGA